MLQLNYFKLQKRRCVSELPARTASALWSSILWAVFSFPLVFTYILSLRSARIYAITKFPTSDIAIAFIAVWLVRSMSVISSYTLWRSHQVLPSWKLIGLNFQVSKRSEFNGNLITRLFHSRLLDTRLVIANSALRVGYYLLISNARSWNNC